MSEERYQRKLDWIHEVMTIQQATPLQKLVMYGLYHEHAQHIVKNEQAAREQKDTVYETDIEKFAKTYGITEQEFMDVLDVLQRYGFLKQMH